ncbi:hypothetical protein GCM10017620_16820 [Brevundimonas intermedia]|uniref:Uncharacterized protein n=1 Tax=Brevundimonas intermedia TaxID=74315 RepID=A0ABQ5T7F7_9CAUL|nr:hypothetical protein GCM10017620_16820 [Brevundimonas intermedia]
MLEQALRATPETRATATPRTRALLRLIKEVSVNSGTWGPSPTRANDISPSGGDAAWLYNTGKRGDDKANRLTKAIRLSAFCDRLLTARVVFCQFP